MGGLCCGYASAQTEMQNDTLNYEMKALFQAGKGTVTPEAFHKMVASGQTILFDFTAKWCGPCQKMKPAIKNLEKELPGKLTVVTVDVDRSKELVQDLKITSIPFLMLFRKGKFVQASAGLISAEDLHKFVQENN